MMITQLLGLDSTAIIVAVIHGGKVARAINVDPKPAAAARALVLGTPLLGALVFCFGFVLLSPKPLGQTPAVSSSKGPSLLVSSPKPKLAEVETLPQQKLSTVDGAATPDNASQPPVKTSTPQSSGSNNLQPSVNPNKKPSVQNLLTEVKRLGN